MHKFIILVIIIGTIFIAYAIHRVIKQYIDPKKSLGYTLLYVVLHLATVFLAAFGSSFLIFKSFSLFFKK